MRRLALLGVAALLAVPSTAAAAVTEGHGVVLSVNRHARTIEVVDGSHHVHRLRYGGKLPNLRSGSRVTFSQRGQTIGHVRSDGRSRQISFLGSVVRATRKGLVLRLADGRHITLPTARIRNAARTAPHGRGVIRHLVDLRLSASDAPTIDIAALPVGSTVLVTEIASGNARTGVTITVPRASGAGPSGSSSPGATSAGTGSAPGAGGGSQDVAGTVTSVDGSGLTITTASGQTLSFVTDSSEVTDGFAAGDSVEVTYVAGAGGRDAVDVEYNELDVVGTVTALSGSSLTLMPDGGGASVTYTVDPTAGLLAGVASGDQVDITYHLSSGQPVVDDLSDDSAASSSGSAG